MSYNSVVYSNTSGTAIYSWQQQLIGSLLSANPNVIPLQARGKHMHVTHEQFINHSLVVYLIRGTCVTLEFWL